MFNLIGKLVTTLCAIVLMVVGAMGAFSGGNFAMRQDPINWYIAGAASIVYCAALTIIGWELLKRIWR